VRALWDLRSAGSRASLSVPRAEEDGVNDIPFHQTRMGQRFYERTLPELVKQIERLNELLERVVESREAT